MLTLTPPDLAADPVCNAIHAMDELSPSAVQRILCTLACRMKAEDYCESDVDLIEQAADVIGPM